MMFVMTTNSIKYGLDTNIIPPEEYEGMIEKIDACGQALMVARMDV
jgi:hypothetical protein